MNNKFASNLKKIRKDNNLSQEQLADELGVSRQAISKWESAAAYPEMDKILALCEKFHLNIDDLLHKDIGEIKGEEESKKKLNQYVEDCLHFITNTINLFSSMSFKSKCKCLFEQIIIAGVLLLVSAAVGNVGLGILSGFYNALPNGVYYVLHAILQVSYELFAIMASVIIFVHIFKTRYLDYYEKVKSDTLTEESVVELPDETGAEELVTEKLEQKHKIFWKKKEPKIVIRDPKHSEYKFINGLFKGIVGLVKLLALCVSVLLFAVLVFLFFGFVVSFLVIKSGMFFVGIVTTVLACIGIDMVLILLMLNFVFNRKNNKKAMIWSFLASVMTVGIGCGLLFIGTLNFEYADDTWVSTKTEMIEFDMHEQLFFETTESIAYAVANISNVQVEYTVNSYCDVGYSSPTDSQVFLWAYCEDPIGLVKEVIHGVNNKKILSSDYEIRDVTIYASRENIAKMQNNRQLYYSFQQSQEELIRNYEKSINELLIQLEEQENTVWEYENEIRWLKEQLSIYEADSNDQA